MLILLSVPGACYRGAELSEKEPPPGYPGGPCLAGGICEEGVCSGLSTVCFDPLEPCRGFYCGGNGYCGVDNQSGEPICACDPGFSNVQYSHYCTPG